MSGITAYETYTTSSTCAGTSPRLCKMDGVIINGASPSVFAIKFKPAQAGTAAIGPRKLSFFLNFFLLNKKESFFLDFHIYIRGII
jgi:hypothetical protein